MAHQTPMKVILLQNTITVPIMWQSDNIYENFAAQRKQVTLEYLASSQAVMKSREMYSTHKTESTNFYITYHDLSYSWYEYTNITIYTKLPKYTKRIHVASVNMYMYITCPWRIKKWIQFAIKHTQFIWPKMLFYVWFYLCHYF